MSISTRQTCSRCNQSLPPDHFVGRRSRPCKQCAACRGAPTEHLTPPFLLVLAPDIPPTQVEAPPVSPPTAVEPLPAPATEPIPALVFDHSLVESSPAVVALNRKVDDLSASFTSVHASLTQVLAILSQSQPTPASAPNPAPTSAPAPVPTPAMSILPVPAPSSPVAGASSAPSPGESQVNCLFPWVSREVIQQIIDDSLLPQDLGKLRNPDTARSLPTPEVDHVFINGVRVEAPTAASSASPVKVFLRHVPDVRTFAQVWAVYASIRACASNDPSLGASLAEFLVHVIDVDATYTWASVAAYILSICRRRFGHTSAADWSLRDHAVHQDHLTATALRATRIPALYRPPPPTPSAPAPPAKCTKLGEVCFRFGTAIPSTAGSGSAPHWLGDFRPRISSAAGLGSAFNRPASVAGHEIPAAGLGALSSTGATGIKIPSAAGLGTATHLDPRPNTDFVADVFDPDIEPARFGSMQDCADNWYRLLRRYPSGTFQRQLLGMIRHGCLLGYDGPLRNAKRSARNLPIPAEGHTHIRRELDARLREGHLTIIPPGTALVESPIGVVPKPRSTKLQTIHHLSHPRKPNGTTLPSVNAGISPSFVRIRYENLDALLSFVSKNPGCLLWKGDLEDTFCHVVTATPDAHLLGFSYDGVRYRENALTFGSSSSPWLFNLVAEFLHWVVAACLPPDWPVGHYLDDTFGAVPASDTTNTLWPVHVLALTAAALGLRLSPKKTFSNTTKLEILGIEIDSVAQTVGITNERRARILSQCRSLLQRRSADLLDMQRIASLLQFVSQVFPCGKAFLRRLYDATRRAASVRCRISRETWAKLTWWCRVLESWSGTTVLSPSPLLVAHIWTDACPRGFGGYLGPASNLQAIFATETPRHHCTKNIRFLEALAVLEALRRFSPLWGTPRLVVVHVDNENVEHGLRLGRSCDPLTQRLIREIYSLCFTRNITLRPVRVSTSDNPAVLPLGTHTNHCHPPPGFAASLAVSPAAATLLWHGLTSSTRQRAGGSPSAFHAFCMRKFGFGTSCFPASSTQLLEWLAHLSASGRSFHAAKHELGALRSHHMDLGLDVTSFGCGRLERALRGYKRLHGVHRTGSKLPITLPLLRRVLEAVSGFADLYPRDHLVFQAAFALAFTCFLHSGKLVWGPNSDPATRLTVSSVKWEQDHAVITLPASKTNPFRQGVKVIAPEVQMDPLFGLGPSGTAAFPRATFVSTLKHAVQAVGLPAHSYAGHSFRRGAATWAAQNGVPDSVIQSLGRWNSDCYRRYINQSATEWRALAASAVFSIRDGPLIPDRPAWRDPGTG
ncbi:uncharacterized protein UHOD_11689 [Ustilago sp. UG-2017b]|nr:uncharacterized protein UHOD_11689 [Ustilago sp. UG-2017b]